MNAITLQKPDGTPTKFSMCGECGIVFADERVAEKCCTCYDCGKPLPPDERVRYADGKGYSLYHRDCERARRAKVEAKQLEKAELVENYTDPVFCDGRRGSFGDGYFADVDELAESLDDEEDQSDRPEFAFCCTPMPFTIDAEQIIESAVEEMDEDAYDRLEGVEDFTKACEAFVEANKGMGSWYEDRKRKVRIPA